MAISHWAYRVTESVIFIMHVFTLKISFWVVLFVLFHVAAWAARLLTAKNTPDLFHFVFFPHKFIGFHTPGCIRFCCKPFIGPDEINHYVICHFHPESSLMVSRLDAPSWVCDVASVQSIKHMTDFNSVIRSDHMIHGRSSFHRRDLTKHYEIDLDQNCSGKFL